MRLIAKSKDESAEEKRFMIYQNEDGVYLFGFLSENDCGAAWDLWFESVEDAIDSCISEHGVDKSDWTEIPDPIEDCQHDRISNIRIKRIATGAPSSGQYEILDDGKWIDLRE